LEALCGLEPHPFVPQLKTKPPWRFRRTVLVSAKCATGGVPRPDVRNWMNRRDLLNSSSGFDPTATFGQNSYQGALEPGAEQTNQTATVKISLFCMRP
jgi:hypothetical protein